MAEPIVKGSPERRVLGELGNMRTEPISPTANLRLLTTLASNLGSASEHGNQLKVMRRTFNVTRDQDPDPFKLLPRKEKSLGLLCNKFLSLYPLDKLDDAPQEISLDSTAKELGTEKRRIYDIINVLESLEMASKAGKNRYLWHGQSSLPTTLAKLKSLAIRLGLREQIREIQRINRAFTGECCEISPCHSTSSVPQSPSLDGSFTDNSVKEDKSLGVMCQKFIMLFLISLKNGVVNLDIAAKVLITDRDQCVEITDTNLRSRFKTKVRRLYDIANVLTAIGLIKKVSMCDSSIRKPVFKYTGPDVDCIDLNADTPMREGTRHSLIGMATPTRSFTRTFFPRFASAESTTTPTRLFMGDSSTPITERREPRKRKLFGPDDKFGRTQSSPCLDVDRPSERLNDSILQVAEMELKRLKSSEELKPKVCTKLFPRHSSETCISSTQVSGDSSDGINNATTVYEFNHAQPINQLNVSNRRQPFLVVSKENLVGRNTFDTPNAFQIANINIPLQINFSNCQAQIPSVSLPNVCNTKIKNDGSIKPLKLKMRDHNVPLLTNVAPKKLASRDLARDGRKVLRIAPYEIQSKTRTPKFVSLTNFDTKKLIPIKPSDFNVSVTPLRPAIAENSSVANTSFAILTQLQTPVLSPGDLFKAVKVGNTLQLVPLRKRCTVTSNTENTATTTSS